MPQEVDVGEMCEKGRQAAVVRALRLAGTKLVAAVTHVASAQAGRN